MAFQRYRSRWPGHCRLTDWSHNPQLESDSHEACKHTPKSPGSQQEQCEVKSTVEETARAACSNVNSRGIISLLDGPVTFPSTHSNRLPRVSCLKSRLNAKPCSLFHAFLHEFSATRLLFLTERCDLLSELDEEVFPVPHHIRGCLAVNLMSFCARGVEAHTCQSPSSPYCFQWKRACRSSLQACRQLLRRRL